MANDEHEALGLHELDSFDELEDYLAKHLQPVESGRGHWALAMTAIGLYLERMVKRALDEKAKA